VINTDEVMNIDIYPLKNFPDDVLGYGINGPATIIHIASPTSNTKLEQIVNKRQADVSEKV
jgi:hypothetical protein